MYSFSIYNFSSLSVVIALVITWLAICQTEYRSFLWSSPTLIAILIHTQTVLTIFPSFLRITCSCHSNWLNRLVLWNCQYSVNKTSNQCSFPFYMQWCLCPAYELYAFTYIQIIDDEFQFSFTHVCDLSKDRIHLDFKTPTRLEV